MNRIPLSNALVLFAAVVSSIGSADCIELTKGPIEIEVEKCEAIDVEKLFTASHVTDAKLGLEALQKLNQSYQGSLVTGTVTKSKALAVGAKTRKQALKGESKTFYLPAKFEKACASLVGKTLKGEVVENCCDGHMESPCLTSTSYTLNPLWQK